MRVELGYAILAGAANVVGALAVTARARWGVRALDTMLAFSAGFMITVALAELVPEAIRRGGESAAVVMLLGFLAVHLTQHTLAAHFHFGEETHQVSSSVSVGALGGLLLHTLVDGVAIASGAQVSASLAALVFAAIFLHKLPEGLAISSLFLAAGSTRSRALLAATLLGVATLIGAIITDFWPALAAIGLPLAAGVTLYVAGANLVPQVQKARSTRTAVAFFAGCVVSYLASRIIA